jgi:hypothetical protein
MSEHDYAWLEGIMADQKEFEESLVGTDGTLADYNTPEFILARGIIGEATEALTDLTHGTLSGAKFEAVDVLIFLSSLFNHLEMTAEEVEMIAKVKMEHNRHKYAPHFFEGRTVKEGIAEARRSHANGTK